MTAPGTARTGGGICPLCTWAQDHGHPHPCITNPGALAILARTLQAYGTLPTTVLEALQAHPARPTAGTLGIRGLRPIHRTWCFCACSPDPATPGPGAARS